MEYIYCFPFISLSQSQSPSPLTPATTHSPQLPVTPRDKQPSLNTSEMLVRFS